MNSVALTLLSGGIPNASRSEQISVARVGLVAGRAKCKPEIRELVFRFLDHLQLVSLVM